MNTNIENFINDIENKADEIFGTRYDTFSQINQFKWGFINIMSKLDEFGIDYKDKNGNITFKSVMSSVKNNTSITSTDIFKPYINRIMILDGILDPTISSESKEVFDLSYLFADDARESYYTAFRSLLNNADPYKSLTWNIGLFLLSYTFYNCKKFNDRIDIVTKENISLQSTFYLTQTTTINISANDIFIYDKDVFNNTYIENLSIAYKNVKIISDSIEMSSSNLTEDSIKTLFKIASVNQLGSNNELYEILKIYLPEQNHVGIDKITSLFDQYNSNGNFKVFYGGEEIT